MNCYIVSRGHVPRMHTAKWIDKTGLNVTWVVHDKAQAANVRSVLPNANIAITNQVGLLSSRNYILRHLVKPLEWYIGMDDNITHLEMVAPKLHGYGSLPVQNKPTTGTWRDIYRHPMQPRYLHRYLKELRVECEAHETIYGGFASTENPMFRARHWSYRRFVKTKLYILRNIDGLTIDGFYYGEPRPIQFNGGDFAHDSWMTTYAIAQYGGVVVNNFVQARHPWYEAGGLGKSTERRAKLDVLLDEIIATFPGLVDKAKGANSALRVLRTSDTAVQRWQAANGWPR